jgi:hypothetical protein
MKEMLLMSREIMLKLDSYTDGDNVHSVHAKCFSYETQNPEHNSFGNAADVALAKVLP